MTGKNFDLTDAIKAYIEDKIGSLTRHFENIIGIDVEVDKQTHHKNGEVFHVRANVQVPKHLIHVEELQADLYAAIDMCKDEADRQLRDYKEKFRTKNKKAWKTRRSLKSILGFGGKDS